MLKEFKMEYLETIKTNLRRTSYIYEGDNNVTILKLYDDNCFSIKKEELDLIKVLFEAEDLQYEVIPFKYQKYKKIFEKYEKNGELWFFEWFFYNDPTTVELFDFKTNKVTDKNWTEDILEAAKMFKYSIHINEKPREWKSYSLLG